MKGAQVVVPRKHFSSEGQKNSVIFQSECKCDGAYILWYFITNFTWRAVGQHIQSDPRPQHINICKTLLSTEKKQEQKRSNKYYCWYVPSGKMLSEWFFFPRNLKDFIFKTQKSFIVLVNVLNFLINRKKTFLFLSMNKRTVLNFRKNRFSGNKLLQFQHKKEVCLVGRVK